MLQKYFNCCNAQSRSFIFCLEITVQFRDCSLWLVFRRIVSFNEEVVFRYCTLQRGECLSENRVDSHKLRCSNVVAVRNPKSDRASDVQFLGSRREDSSLLTVSHIPSRRFWILPPAQMGRRSSKIATKKVTISLPQSFSSILNFSVLLLLCAAMYSLEHYAKCGSLSTDDGEYPPVCVLYFQGAQDKKNPSFMARWESRLFQRE